MLRWKSSLKPTSGGGGADYRSTVLADNPLFYYRLGETSGATALDEVTSSSNGTYYNTPSLGQTGAISGDSNTSVLFEQANGEYAKTVTLSSETSLLPCTIECFIKLSGASDDNAGIVFYRSGSYTASGLNIRGTALGKLGYHWANNSNTYFYSGGPTLSDNTWYYVALVVESTKATFYVIEEDGTLTTAVNSVSHSALDCSNDGWLIARDQNVRYFQGYLDEVAIYDQALSQSTLVAHAAAAGYAASAITLEASAVTTAISFSTPLSIDVNIPAVSTDDILLLLVTTNDLSSPTDSPPSGWTKIVEQDGTSSSQSTVAAYWKRASSSSVATTETWSSFFPNPEYYYIWVGAYSGCVTSGSPVDAYGTAAFGFSSSWSVDVTTTVSNTMIVTISGATQPAVTHTWTDGTELIDTAYQSEAAVSINEKLESTAGSKTRTVTPSTTSGNSMIAVALRDTAPTPLQTRTVTFTSISEFTIDSDSGQEIWSSSKLNQASVGSTPNGLRLWNGSEAGNSGATYDSGTQRWSFSSPTACATWWQNYYIRVKQDPNTGTFSDWINITDANGDIYISTQAPYNNIGSNVTNYSGPGTWTSHASGFRYQMEIYSASNRP
jgi:hypothetical protein